ncbi:hypothetical protein ACYSUW_13725 [Pseudomonas frederiksbergensis]
MSDLNTIPPNHQAFVVEAFLADLQAAGWNPVTVTQVLSNKPPYAVPVLAQALQIILVSEIALLEVEHEKDGRQSVRLDVGAGTGTTIFSSWTKYPAFNSLVTAFIAGLPSRMLQGIPDIRLSSEQLRTRYEAAGEHARFTKQGWKDEVENDETIRGYWDWVMAQIEQAGDES